jgi:hypothetical protein
MRDMSRAIRHELEDHGANLQAIPTLLLREYVQILGAFYFDLRDELERRMPGSLAVCEEAPPSESSSS